jgi:phosphosulfolactate phosphohydrolase-like enzyme
LGADLPALLRGSGWGERLCGLGLEPDLALCAVVDATDVVPVMRDGRITSG